MGYTLAPKSLESCGIALVSLSCKTCFMLMDYHHSCSTFALTCLVHHTLAFLHEHSSFVHDRSLFVHRSSVFVHERSSFLRRSFMHDRSSTMLVLIRSSCAFHDQMMNVHA